MKRREFLQLSGAMVAGGALSSCRGDAGELIPLLVPPDDGSIPGLATHYATTCLQCPAGCGIHVRVFEGRARKIEGNPDHPVNRGRLCARGQAGLQELYHPDRVRTPLQRKTPEGPLEPATWPEATARMVSRLRDLSARSAGSVILFTPPLQGVRRDIVSAFASTVRAEHIRYDSLNTLVHLEASRQIAGTSTLPDYDLSEAQLVLSLGADVLETFQSPVRFAEGYGRMRRERSTVRGLFVYAGPRMSQTAACADEWLPIKPGTEGILAAGIARYLIEQRLFNRDSVSAWGIDPDAQFSLLNPFDPARVAEDTDLPVSRVLALCRDFGRLRPAMALAGDGPGAHTNGLDSVRLVHLLNILTGSMGSNARIPARGADADDALPSSPGAIQGAIRRMARGEVLAVLFMEVNPVVTLPASLGFRKALAEVPFIVSLSTVSDDTARLAHIVLPTAAGLERWSDVHPAVRPGGFELGLAQPVVSPLYDLPCPEDVLLNAAREISGNSGSPPFPGDFRTALAERVETLTRNLPGTAGERWVSALQKGGLWTDQEHVALDRPRAGSISVPAPRPPAFSGTEQEFPFILHLYLSPMLLDGRSAMLPWLQETPDPMSTVRWGSWVEINPRTAAQLDLRHGDWVDVESSVVSIPLPVVVFPGIRPDVVAIPRGQGADAGGRYAEGRGANPMALVSAETDPENDLPAWGATRVRLRKIPSRGMLITSGHPEGSYRGELIGL